MAELEKVIKGIELCLQGDSNFCELSCPYYQQCGAFYENNEALLKAALSLLKAQESVKPYIDYDGQDVWRCGSCGATLFHLSHTHADENEQNCVKFCRYCGKAVKWE